MITRRRPRECTKILNVGGKLIKAVTIEGLARIVGKSKDSILRYERLEVFPPAPLLVGERNVRYYPVDLAKKLVPLVAKIPSYKRADSSLIFEISKCFKESKEQISNA